MRTVWIIAVVGFLGVVTMPPARGQSGLRGVGAGPSTTFETGLPTSGINRTLGFTGAFTTGAGVTARPPSPVAASLLASRGLFVNLKESGWRPITFDALAPGPGLGPLVKLKVRSIDSMSFAKRARFARLRETTLALAQRIREVDESSLGQVSLGFRQFMFPFPLVEGPGFDYGFFSRTDLVGGGTIPRDAFLSQFTDEVQQSLGEKQFLDVTEALLLGRMPPEGISLEQFYDTQLAALGNYLFNNRQYATAAQVWRVRIQRDETSAVSRRAAALCLLAAGQMSLAAREARQSLVLADGWPDRFRIAGSNLQDVFPTASDLAEIRHELEAQLAKLPDDPDLNFLMAYVDLFQGNLRAAEERLARLGPQDEVARHLLDRIKAGAVADTVKRPIRAVLRRVAEELTGLEEPALTPEARWRLIGVLREGASTYEDYMRLGDFRFFMGNFTVAGEMYRAAHEARPQDPFALFAMAHGAYANGESRMAARYLKDALALEPNWGLYEFRLQEFYGDSEEYERHMRNLERQVELRPTRVDLRFLLAYAYYFSGRYADATDLLAEVLRLQPDFERAGYLLRLARLQG